VNQPTRRNRLTPWYVGIAIVILGIIYVGYQMIATNCAAPPIAILGVLVVIPVVYLVLMYLTFVSQE
jgi:hypothetical protein